MSQELGMTHVRYLGAHPLPQQVGLIDPEGFTAFPTPGPYLLHGKQRVGRCTRHRYGKVVEPTPPVADRRATHSREPGDVCRPQQDPRGYVFVIPISGAHQRPPTLIGASTPWD